MASVEDYRRRANMHQRYLSECRTKRKTNDSYQSMMVDVAADMVFCDRAALHFDEDPSKMAEALNIDVEKFLQRGDIASDIPQQAFAKELRKRLKAFHKQANEGKHLVP